MLKRVFSAVMFILLLTSMLTLAFNIRPARALEMVFDVIWEGVVYPVAVVSNSTVTNFNFAYSLKQISFNVAGPDDTIGFCNVTIPKALLWVENPYEWILLIDGNPATIPAITENATHNSLYFAHTHSTHEVRIIGTHVHESSLPVHNIDTGVGYATIQEAINANETLDGHTIFAEAGTYYENVVVNKSLTLMGENKEATVIDGDENGTVVLVIANNTMISEFTIRGSGDKTVDGEHAIRCGIMVGGYETPFENVLIVGNSIKNNYFGVLLWYSFNSQLIDNDINNCTYGVTLDHAFCNDIVENNVSNNSLGISAQNTLQSNITSNHITFDKIEGLRMQDSYLNTINENIVENNGYGIDLSESDGNNVTSNTVTGNSWGIFLGLSSNNLIYYNNVISNIVYGVYLQNSVSNMIMNNTVSTSSTGLYLYYYSNFNTIRGNIVTDNFDGMDLYYYSNDNDVCDNIVSHCAGGFRLEYSNNNTIDNNTVTSNRFVGIYLASYSYNNIIRQNIIADNNRGINQLYSENNTIYHNSFLNNTELPETNTYSANIWDNGYPSGGNYWSDYNGTDLYSGPYQNETGSDGIGDSPYVIDVNNQDRYPLGVFGVHLIGDLNGDGIVDILDAVQAASAFGSYPGHPNWNSLADLNHDNEVDIFDLIMLVNNFGKH